MKQSYYFGINNQRIGPLKEEEIRQRMENKSINGQTLAWCADMKDWKPVQEIPELVNIFGKFISNSTVPPPLPVQQTAIPQQNALNDLAYRFVLWCFRPAWGRPNFVREYVVKDNRRAIPVAVFTIAVFLFCMIAVIVNISQSTKATTANVQQMQQYGSGAVDWQTVYREGRDVQRYQQQLSDDSYRYRRDSQDRSDEAYRRANYDWYRDNN